MKRNTIHISGFSTFWKK